MLMLMLTDSNRFCRPVAGYAWMRDPDDRRHYTDADADLRPSPKSYRDEQVRIASWHLLRPMPLTSSAFQDGLHARDHDRLRYQYG